MTTSPRSKAHALLGQFGGCTAEPDGFSGTHSLPCERTTEFIEAHEAALASVERERDTFRDEAVEMLHEKCEAERECDAARTALAVARAALERAEEDLTNAVNDYVPDDVLAGMKAARRALAALTGGDAGDETKGRER